MKRRNIIMLAAAAVLAMLMLASCSSLETGEVTGTLVSAAQDSIVVSGSDGSEEFITTDETVYDLNGESELYVNDIVEVKYHSKGRKKYADEIEIIKHVHEDLTFDGTVSSLKEDEVVVSGPSLSVTFLKDKDTDIQGDLSEGDEVTVIYVGNLSEYPYAETITVTKEKEEPEDLTVSGIVSEFTEKSMLLAIDSATSYRFTFEKGTRITGAAKYVHTGDSVNVTYSGDLTKTPVALIINIVKVAEPEKLTINGTIGSVEKAYVTLYSGGKSYIIHTNKDTKYTGDKPAKGYKSEISYYKSDDKTLTATNIYCVKSEKKAVKYDVTFTDGMGNTLKTQEVEKGKAAKAPETPKREGYTFDGWDKDFSKVTSDLTVNAKWKKNEDPEPEEPVTAQGTITKWVSGDDDTFVVDTEDGSELTLTQADDMTFDPEAGYFPAVNDVVKVTYLESTMAASNIALVSRPEAEKKEEESKPEEQAEPEEEPEPEEQAEPEEEPEPEEQAEPEEEPEPEEKAEPEEKKEEKPAEVIVKADATIIKGNEDKQTVELQIKDGDKITLSIDKNTKIASGYFPEKEDVVKITYEKNGMLLKEIQLIERPAPADNGDAEE